MRTRHALAIAAFFLLGGCFERALLPVNPCTRSNVVERIDVENVDEVDLLFMIDNSGSMSEEQVALTRELPSMVRALASGDRNGDGTQDFTPVRSLHIGVITSDMGTGGHAVATCDRGTFGTRFGDDGVLVTRGRTVLPGCMATYPSIFEFSRGVTDPDAFARDVACVATTGTGGCGFEQQLEAVLKATSPSAPTVYTGEGYVPPIFAENTLGHGDRENAGLVRDGSALAIVMVTDEEDCSVRDPRVFDMASAEYPGDLNLRCFMYGATVQHPITRYVRGEDGRSGLIGLRHDNPGLLVFAGIVGVPIDTVDPVPGAERQDYDAMLAHPLMIEELDPTAPPMTPRLRPSCSTTNGVAFPPRRIVSTAQELERAGASVTIQSICQDSYAGALDEIIEKIAGALGGACLPRELNPDADGFADCQVFEVLPTRGTTTTCDGLTGRTPAGTVNVEGVERALCEVRQVGPTDGLAGMAGWYYENAAVAMLDDDSTLLETCVEPGRQQRIRFTIDPITGSEIRLECLQTVQPGSAGAASIGAFCDPAAASACMGGLAPDRATALACDALDRTCAVPCVETSDCTQAGLLGDVCDSRTWMDAIVSSDPDATDDQRARRIAQITAAGVDLSAPHAFCVNPTCI